MRARGAPAKGYAVGLPSLQAPLPVLILRIYRLLQLLAARDRAHVKKHSFKRFGTPELHPFASGGSGGAFKQYVYARNHPGLLEAGGRPSRELLPYPDPWSPRPS